MMKNFLIILMLLCSNTVHSMRSREQAPLQDDFGIFDFLKKKEQEKMKSSNELNSGDIYQNTPSNQGSQEKSLESVFMGGSKVEKSFLPLDQSFSFFPEEPLQSSPNPIIGDSILSQESSLQNTVELALTSNSIQATDTSSSPGVLILGDTDVIFGNNKESQPLLNPSELIQLQEQIQVGTSTESQQAEDTASTEDTTTDNVSVEGSPTESNPAEDTPVEDTPVEATPVEDIPVEDNPVQDTPTESTASEATPTESTEGNNTEGSGAEATPTESTETTESTESTPTEESAAEETQTKSTSTESTATEETPVEDTSVENTLTESAVEETASTEDTSTESSPVEETTGSEETTPTEGTPVEGTAVEQSAAEDTPVESTTGQDTSVEGTPAENGSEGTSSVEGTPVEGTPSENTPVENAAVEDTTSEASPVENAPIEGSSGENTLTEASVESSPIEASAESSPTEASVESSPTEASVEGGTIEAPVESSSTEGNATESNAAEATTTTSTAAETSLEATPVEVSTEATTIQNQGPAESSAVPQQTENVSSVEASPTEQHPQQAQAEAGMTEASTTEGSATQSPNTNLVNFSTKQEPITCAGAQSEFIQTVCSLCQATEAFVLTKENWFVIGLTHNYRAELSKLLTYVEPLFPNARWLAAFSDANICIVSTTEMKDVNIDNVINSITSQHLADYIKGNLVTADALSTVYLSGFRYVPLGDKSYIDQFLLKFKIDMTIPISKESSIKLTTALIHTAEKNVVYSGTINLKNLPEMPFDLNIDKPNSFYNVNASLAGIPLSTSEIVGGIPLSEFDKNSLFQKIEMTNGLNNYPRYQASFLQCRIVEESKTVDQLTIGLYRTPSFAITPEFRLVNAKSTIQIDFKNSVYVPTLIIQGQATDSKQKEPFNIRVSKTEQSQNIILTPSETNLLQISALEDVFKTHDTTFEGFFPNYANFDTIRKYYLLDAEIQAKNNPIAAYLVKSKVMVNGADTIGTFDALLTFIGGTLNVQAKISLPKENLLVILPSGSPPLFFEQNTTPQGLQITHCNHDIDTEQHPQAFEGFYKGERYWRRGTTLSYTFVLNNCSENAFCNVMTSMMDCTAGPITLSGGVDNNATLKLSSETLPGTISVSTINFKEIHLNLDIILGQNLQYELYLTSQNTFQVDVDRSLTLDGKLIFNETHANLASKTTETWTNAVGLDFLQISAPEVTGIVAPGSCYITDVAAQGVVLWGKSCFIMTQDDSHNLIFLKDRCFYGKGEIMLNLNNIKKSYVTGTFSGLTPLIVLSSVLQYDDSFIFQTVSSQFLANKFLDYVEIIYVPRKDSATTPTSSDQGTSATPTEGETSTSTEANPATEGSPASSTEETALIEIQVGNQVYPAGFSIRGNSEMIGLKGVTTLHADTDTKEVFALFHFDNFEIANGNIMLKGGSVEKSNNIQFKISTDNTDQTNAKGVMESKLTLFGIDGEASFTFTTQDITFKGSLSSDVLSHIEVTGSSAQSKNFVEAQFNVQGSATDKFTDINTMIKDLFKTWAKKVSSLIAGVNQNLHELDLYVQENGQMLCTEDSCPSRYQCQSDPIYQCTKYKKKQVCTNKQDYCLNTAMVCTRNETTCSHELESCSRRDAAGRCLQIKTDCLNYVTTCQEWQYVCMGDKMPTCEEFDIIDDQTECLEYGWNCNEALLPDSECQNGCNFRREQFQQLNQTYTTLKSKYEQGLQNQNEQLKSFIALLEDNTGADQELELLSFKFTVDSFKKYVTKDIPWKVEYNLFGKKRTVDVSNLSLIDQREFGDVLFNAIGQQLSAEYIFKWMSPQEFENQIQGKLDLTGQPASLLIQVLQNMVNDMHSKGLASF